MSPTAPQRTTVLVDGEPVGWLDDLRDESEYDTIRTLTPEPDPTWRYTDRAGHVHRWSNARHGRLVWPGAWVAVEQVPGYWCPDCREHHDGRVERRARCVLCGEWLEPGTWVPPPRRILIARDVTLAVLSTDLPPQDLDGQVDLAPAGGHTIRLGRGVVDGVASAHDPALTRFDIHVVGPPDASG